MSSADVAKLPGGGRWSRDKEAFVYIYIVRSLFVWVKSSLQKEVKFFSRTFNIRSDQRAPYGGVCMPMASAFAGATATADDVMIDFLQ